MRTSFLIVSALILISGMLFAGTTGKIVGTIVDARTGEPLPSVNVTVAGTNLGASTNVDGFYTILNVPPGVYRLQASIVGYRSVSTVNVKVDIDQTTTQNFQLNEETISSEEITVVASRPVVQRDVAASRANIDIAEVTKLPVSTVLAAVGLQAGVQGLSIRGGGASETAFMVDGLTLRDERTNSPYTSISLMSVEAVQVQSGGFSAEYGNVRSGIINVVTREGKKDAYSVGIQTRYAPARPKHFGPSIYDFNSYWIRPYLDDAVAWTGTQNGAWDQFTQNQYPSFDGWNALSARWNSDADPLNDLTPQALQQLFRWQYRRIAEITQPDYNIDLSFGGPVPVLGKYLGGLRFLASFTKSQSMYLVPLSDDAYRDYSGRVKLTSDITTTMKLNVEGMMGRTTGTNNNNGGLPGVFQTAGDIGAVMNRVSYINTRIFATEYWAPTRIDYKSAGIKLSQTLGTKTYYDASLSMFQSKYNTNVGRLRDTSKIMRFGSSYLVDESPFGFFGGTTTGGLADLRFSVGFSNSRDTSTTTVYSGRFDLTTQLDKYNQIKAGAEFTYTKQDIHYAVFDEYLKDATFNTAYSTSPTKGAVYVKDKLEFEGMVADLGVRLDYLNPGGDWYVYNPYDAAFGPEMGLGFDTLLAKAPTEKQVLLSPRLAIAFPITDDAKLFFNYGHFYQQPAADQLFVLRRSGFDNSISRIADPNAPLPRTIQYELGYEHSLFDEYLVRITAYYKDITDEPLNVTYEQKNGDFTYTKATSNSYRDIRGFEATLQKTRGNWVQGFINYTYDVRTSGYFGTARYFQNPLDQTTYLRSNIPQSRPIPQPYARMNLDFFTPQEFGPKIGGFPLLGDVRINLLGSWSSGFHFTWAGGGSIPGLENNVQWNDFWNVDLRIAKNFRIGPVDFELFADVSNLFNYRYMSQYGFVTGTDYTDYLKSLHLPAFSEDIDRQVGYVNIAGEDTPGDYRAEGVAFQPIVALRTAAALAQVTSPQTRPFYFVQEQGRYYQWVNNVWQQVDAGTLDQVMEEKAYIDMPNMETFTFLNPRRIFYGARLTVNL